MFCLHCQEIAEYALVRGRIQENVCREHFKLTYITMAQQGVESFTLWAIQNFGFERTRGLLESLIDQGLYSKQDADAEYARLSGPMAMFTYGILKYPNNIAEEGGTNIVENCTVEGQQMFLYNNSFPITKQTGESKDVIFGTCFEIPTYMVLANYDIIEGHDPKGDPSNNMYNRQIVDVKLPSGEIKQATMYIANEAWFEEYMNDYYRIFTGNFDDKDQAGVRI